MRLRELFVEGIVEPDERNLPQSTAFNVKKMGDRAKSEIGTYPSNGGLYARGIEDPKDPFMYRKKSRQPSNLDNDAYYQFIKFVRPYMGDNPFFPRVYSIDVKVDANGLKKPAYKMEKLMSLDAAAAAFGGSGELDQVFKDMYFSRPTEGRSAIFVIRDILSGLKKSDIVADENLSEAIWVIRKFLDKFPDFSLDFHKGNVMVRFTPAGPQMVFTDPVEDDGQSIIGFVPSGAGSKGTWNLPGQQTASTTLSKEKNKSSNPLTGTWQNENT